MSNYSLLGRQRQRLHCFKYYAHQSSYVAALIIALAPSYLAWSNNGQLAFPPSVFVCSILRFFPHIFTCLYWIILDRKEEILSDMLFCAFANFLSRGWKFFPFCLYACYIIVCLSRLANGDITFSETWMMLIFVYKRRAQMGSEKEWIGLGSYWFADIFLTPPLLQF